MNAEILKHQRLAIIFRLSLIFLFMAAASVLFDGWNRWYWPLICLLLCMWQIVSLFKLLDRRNRDMVRFLEAVKYEDFQQSFTEKAALGGTDAALYAAFHEVFTLFRQNSEKGEQQHRYLQTLIEPIDIGLLSVGTDGRIDFINRAARHLLRLGHLASLGDLEGAFGSDFVSTLQNIRHGEKRTLAVEGEKVRFSALIYASSLRVGNRSLKLISLQNIDKVLEEKELQAWQSLIKVLTHEIMNSMTPIVSLSDTATGLMKDMDLKDNDALGDVCDALQTIRSRSIGLMDFVKAYRNLTLIPKPNFGLVSVGELFTKLGHLLENRLQANRIELAVRVDPQSLTLTADAALIEQVLLNLIINAIHALKGRSSARIALCAYLDDSGRTAISVHDNGSGIAESARDKIFIPFFSTKETGSGIGLSFSRQIMRLHNGHIELAPESGEGTTFILTF